MSKIDYMIGEFILLKDKLPIVNKNYVNLVGYYYKRLSQLPYQPIADERRNELLKLYTREYNSARFWASYPEDVSKICPKTKRAIFLREFGRKRT